MPTKSITVGDNSTRLPPDQIIVDITNYVFHYEISPDSKVWERAKTALFDALGCVFETLKQSPEASTIIGPVVPETIVPNGFKLPGTSFQLDPIKGAFDLGFLIRYVDHNDAFPRAEWGHPSDNIGAILSVADWLSRTAHRNDPKCHKDTPILMMKTVLLAMIKAYEIQGVLQIRDAFNEMGLDHTILVCIASTAVVCHLLGCSESETRAGISHAFIDTGRLHTYRQYPNTDPRKGWATGDTCMRAVHLALLTRKGQPGAPTALSVMMGKKKFHLSRPFGTWVVETNFFRVHPTEDYAASAIEAALILSKQLQTYSASFLDLPLEEIISQIQVRTQKPATIAINKYRPLDNAADRNHCVRYMIAVVLLKGSIISASDYSNDSPWVTDPRVDILRAKIEMTENEQFTVEHHNTETRSCVNALRLILADGQKLKEVLVEYSSGHSWRNDTPDTVKEKFGTNVRGWFSDERSQKILRLAEIGVNDFMVMGVSEFMDTLTGGGDSEKKSLANVVDSDAKDPNPAAAIGEAMLAGDLSDGDGFRILVASNKELLTSDRSSSDSASSVAKTLGAEVPNPMNRSDEALSILAATGSDEQQSAVCLLERNEAKVVDLENAQIENYIPGAKAEPLTDKENAPSIVNESSTQPISNGLRAALTSAGMNDLNAPSNRNLDRYGKMKNEDAVCDGETYTLAFPTGECPHPSPHISYGLPFPRACAKHVAHTFQGRRVYILVSANLSSRTCDLPCLHAAIDKELGEDTVVGIRRGVRPHIYYSDILKIVREAKEVNTDCLVTLGGGSLTDTAKVVALALANDATAIDELETLYLDSPTLRDPLVSGKIPIICIPTTLSAGEYTPFADATNDITHHKHSFQHPSLGPRLIVLDPILTITTPLRVWFSTGIRAIDHCIESLCSIKASPKDDAIAEKGLRRLLPGLLTTKAHPKDLGARIACQLGAVEAISAPLNGVPMGASHGIGQQLGPLGVGHGETSCILLPAVCKYNKRVNAKKQQRILDILWSEGAIVDTIEKAGLEREKADLGDVLGAVINHLGMPRSLLEVGVRREKFAELVVGSLDDCRCKTNPIPLEDPQQVLEILEMCYEEPSRPTEAITENQAPQYKRARFQEEENDVQAATQNQTHQEERTFRQYTPDQAKAYAAWRSSYHANLYKIIFDHHDSTGGAFKTLMDVGCGPGNATRPLAKRFETAYGVDPSPEMINTAKRPGKESLGMVETASGNKIDFLVGRAEDMGGSNWDIGGKVDLLTAGMAAHWFDMAEFWASAARLVNKGGTVALWTASSLYPHPSTPNASNVKATFSRLEREFLDPYETQGNRIARNCYDDLTLPWDVNPPTEGFSRDGFTRLVWDRDGHLSSGDHFFLGDQHVTLTQLQKQLGTTSVVTRWREAHPRFANTDEDIVVKMIQQAREAIGGEELIVGKSCTLLLFKKD